MLIRRQFMKQFKTQSKRILDLMINSIYTHKEIFLRELISNCSDALDKLCYKSLTDGSGLDRSTLEIKIAVNNAARTLTISDNGIGMTQEELDKNLGTIAQSGSFEFKNSNEKKEDLDIIGQFGVGFYSAFMVAQKVVLVSKAYGADTANMWVSDGVNGYEIKPAEKATNGTEVVLFLKDNTEDEDYDKFLNEYQIKTLIKKYSDYIRFPIKMLCTKYLPSEEGEETKTEQVEETLNSMVPIWKKNKNEITDENYNTFYRDTFYDTEEPVARIHTSVEGAVDYKALLFIPSKAPYNYYSKTYEKGLKLYTNGVLITERSEELLPDYFSFVRGVVDSELKLNISRETIQNNRQLSLIEKNIEKKIKNELENLLKNDREKYQKFFKEFGMNLKYGVYSDWGQNKEILQDLLIFDTVKEDSMVSLKEYVDKMPADQKYIYYANGLNKDRIKALPQSEKVVEQGYDIICCTENVDEFALKAIGKYSDKEFKSISEQDNGIENKDEETVQEDTKEITDFIKEALGDKVVAVIASKRLKSHFVCLTSKGELSIEMEKVLNALPNADNIKAEKVLEINVDHPAFEKVKNAYANDKDKLKQMALVMFASAGLIEGLLPDNPTELSDAIFSLIE